MFRGVVMLFNAVHQAQKQQTDAVSQARKAVKLNKASFLAQLRASGDTTLGQKADGGAAPAAAERRGRQGQAGAATGGGEAAAGWKVLHQGFSGLTKGGSKMKDWDRAAGSDDEGGPASEQMAAGSDSDGNDGW